MQIKLFIAGTDTGVGKTYISVGLIKAFHRLGYSTLGIKPVASGCRKQNEKFFNEDALALQQASSIQLPYKHINPFAFKEPISPHLAAEKAGTHLTVRAIKEQIQFAYSKAADFCLIEGAGGWYTPINQNETLADFVIQEKIPVLLVVGMRLGCLNHAMLTYQAMKHDGVNVLAWVANCIDENMLYCDENMETLKAKLPVCFLGKVHYNAQPENALNLHPLKITA